MAEEAYRIVVSGLVTGVGFRYSALRAARERDLKGHVRNADARTVACVIQGQSGDVRSMLAWLRTGPPSARVLDYRLVELPCDPELGPFQIEY